MVEKTGHAITVWRKMVDDDWSGGMVSEFHAG